MNLFRIESRSASEMGRPPGEWDAEPGGADTLDAAKAMKKEVYARGWIDTQIVVVPEVAEAVRIERDRMRSALEVIANLADTTDTNQEAADSAIRIAKAALVST